MYRKSKVTIDCQLSFFSSVSFLATKLMITQIKELSIGMH